MTTPISSPSGIEDLHSKRDELNRQIKQGEEEKDRLQHDIRILSERLSSVNESLAQRLAARATFDRTIAETEGAYTKACVYSIHLIFILSLFGGFGVFEQLEPTRSLAWHDAYHS